MWRITLKECEKRKNKVLRPGIKQCLENNIQLGQLWGGLSFGEEKAASFTYEIKK